MAGKYSKKVLHLLGISVDEDDDYEDDYDYLDDDYEDSGKPIFKKKVKEEDFEEDFADERLSRKAKSIKPIQKITPMKQSKRQGTEMEVCIIKPTTYEESGKYIADTLLENRTVVLNLEGIDVELAQRILDFAYGSCYAIRGNFCPISKSIILISPANVEISGETLEQINSTLSFSNLDF